MVAAALRDFTVRGAVTDGTDGSGTALYGAGGELLALDERAEELFEEIAGQHWRHQSHSMTPVRAVVARAVAVLEGRDRGPASARVRAASGRWLFMHGSCLRGSDPVRAPTALTVEPARSSQVAPLIVAAYALTPREQQVTRALARGLSTHEIAAELFLSPHTVRDYVKTVLAKVGVGTRGELVARLFADHFAPLLHARCADVQR